MTDPYCPTIAATSPDDFPLVFKSGDIFPTISVQIMCSSYHENGAGVSQRNSHVETTHDMP